jgi:hypothetical protein
MSQINARLVYRNAVRSMKAAGVDPSKAILSQSFLRFERVASTAVTNYQFGVLLNDTPQGQAVRPLENRLQLQDAFYCSSVQVYFSYTADVNNTNYAPSFFPSTTSASSAAIAAALGNFYNGQLSLSVNNRTIVTAWSLLRHLDIPMTQSTTGTTAAPLDQKNGGTSGSFVCEPNWVLIGSKNNQLSIQLPAAIGTLPAAPAGIILGITLYGVLAQNCTVVS